MGERMTGIAALAINWLCGGVLVMADAVHGPVSITEVSVPLMVYLGSMVTTFLIAYRIGREHERISGRRTKNG